MTDAVVDTLDSAERHPLPPPGRSRRVALNPSIAARPDGGYAVVVRHVNYLLVDGRYQMLDDDDVIRTTNELVLLDDEFSIVDRQPIDDSFARTQPARFPVEGLEDLRLIPATDGWWGTATLREHRHDGLAEMVVVHLTDAVIDSAVVYGSPKAGRYEKNWSPIEDDRRRWLWSHDPAIVLTHDSALDALVPHRPLPLELGLPAVRGGSQVIRIADGWLSVVHQVSMSATGHRIYRHRLVVHDDDWELVAVSEPFSFTGFDVEFCAGVARTADGLVMSYGIDDRSAELMTISYADASALAGHAVDAPRERGA